MPTAPTWRNRCAKQPSWWWQYTMYYEVLMYAQPSSRGCSTDTPITDTVCHIPLPLAGEKTCLAWGTLLCETFIAQLGASVIQQLLHNPSYTQFSGSHKLIESISPLRGCCFFSYIYIVLFPWISPLFSSLTSIFNNTWVHKWRWEVNIVTENKEKNMYGNGNKQMEGTFADDILSCLLIVLCSLIFWVPLSITNVS